jgi:salicylate hydroxylase
VRRSIVADAEPQFVGATATRTVIPSAEAEELAMPAVGLWLTPGVHVVHYPVREGREIAVVVISAENWQGKEWDAEADAATLRSRLTGFHVRVASILERARDWRKWALYRSVLLPKWTLGRITLLGDAAHPMLPYLAQGGVMALEDALVLARYLSTSNDECAALLDYEKARRARTTRVQALSLRNGRIYHMRPPLSWARDAALRLLPGAGTMARLDWLYGWQVPVD